MGFLLAWVTPRRNDHWVFGSGIGVGEGALALALAVQRADPGSTVTWLIETETQRQTAAHYGFATERKDSWKGFWVTLRSRYLVVTHGLGDVQRFGVFRAEVINLWHGAPLKKLHMDSPVTTRVNAPGYIGRILQRMYEVGSKQVTVYPAGSLTAAHRLRSAFRVQPGTVQLLGDPRLDEMFEVLHSSERCAEQTEKLQQLLGLPPEQHENTLVLYAPTWRDGEASPVVPHADECEEIRAWAERHRVTLVVRPHPLETGNYASLYGGNVVELSPSVLPDISPYLPVFDLLITDFSSVAIDFAPTHRPIVWFAPDEASYAAQRGLYEPYAVTTEGHWSTSWSATLERIEQILSNEAVARAAKLRAKRLSDRFHVYTDGGSAKRVLEYIHHVREIRSRSSELQPTIFFESFYGTSATCNPFALDREISTRYPELPRFWSVTNESVSVPPGAIPILIGSPEWEWVRRTSRLLIINDWLRFNFRRRRGQFVLQTWHGTPLKRLALDRPERSLRTTLAILRESRRWNVLLTQNQHATTVLGRSYRMRHRTLELGYPRNDRLANSQAHGERLRIHQANARARLGIPQDNRVLLYAPTWREHQRRLVDHLNVGKLGEALGPRWTILARGHSRDQLLGRYQGAHVLDMTHHPDVNDLMIAADVFITDYSSLMFDASVARVPTILFMPDLVEYREEERGFTFEIEEVPPGPILATTKDVVQHLKQYEIEGYDASWIREAGHSREVWHETFNRHEDGHASERVVDWLEEQGRIPTISSLVSPRLINDVVRAKTDAPEEP